MFPSSRHSQDIFFLFVLFRDVSWQVVSMVVPVCLTKRNKHFHVPAKNRTSGLERNVKLKSVTRQIVYLATVVFLFLYKQLTFLPKKNMRKLSWKCFNNLDATLHRKINVKCFVSLTRSISINFNYHYYYYLFIIIIIYLLLFIYYYLLLLFIFQMLLHVIRLKWWPTRSYLMESTC